MEFDKSFVSIWFEPMGLSPEQVHDLEKQLPDLSHPYNKLFCQDIRDFSQKNKVSFYLCSVYALEFYKQGSIRKGDIEKHLSKKILPNPENLVSHSYKTIMLTGRSGEGKSLLTNHLVGENIAEVGHTSSSQTQGANLYTSDLCQLNIIDSEGLDGTCPDESNQQLMEKIRLKTMFLLELDASIDAIILVWCPLKNGRSILVKTLEALEKSFGSDILNSCIVMIQGDWKPHAEVLNLDTAVPHGKQEIQTKYPNLPILEYDAKGSVKEQSYLLKEAIGRVKKYSAQSFQIHQDFQFLTMAEGFQIKVKEFGSGSDQLQQFCKDFQSSMLELLKKRGHFVERKKKFSEEFFKLFKRFIFCRQCPNERKNDFQKFLAETKLSTPQRIFSQVVLWPFL